MTTSTNSGAEQQPNWVGNQRPRILSVPASTSSIGVEAVQLAAAAGLVLDPWQEFVLETSLGVRDGKWSAFEVGLCVPRQNGKGSILEARELAGLFLLGEKLIIHSAHEYATSGEAFLRLLTLIESTPELERRVKRTPRAHGNEGIDLVNGQRIRFRTRTKGGGRGFSADCVILDEAMILPEAMHGALLPTLSARPNPQVWYTGSAVDQDVHEHGEVFARVRSRGVAGGDSSLAYYEWSMDATNPDDVPVGLLSSPEAIAQANPGLGIRISLEHVANERASMTPRTYTVERGGVGDWPDPELDGAVISIEDWSSLADGASKALDPVVFTYEVPLSRSSATIGVAGRRKDGRVHVEVVETRPGTGWVAKRLAELTSKNRSLEVLHAGGSAKSLQTEIEKEGVKVRELTSGEYSQACGMLFDKVEQKGLKHLGTADLVNALRVAVKRAMGEAWVWDRRASSVDISPLVVVTLGCWGVVSLKPRGRTFVVIDLNAPPEDA